MGELLGVDIKSWLWIIFFILIASFLILDLGIFNKNPQKVSMKSAMRQSALWVSISLCFSVFIYFYYNPPGVSAHKSAFDFLTAYVTEYALSVDNIFVIILILRYFKVEDQYYHKILFWGILGALVMRGFFIILGAELVHQFHWILYIFGAFLLYTGLKMLFSKEQDENDVNPENSFIIKLARKYLRFTTHHEGGKFWIKKNGHFFFTQLFLVILLIESTDLIFAVDSIPAAFAITQDEVILYTSNIFAVMGLRAMFFMLSSILDKFYLLPKALSLVLIFIGAKMFEHIIGFELPAYISFIVILTLLFGSIFLSLMFPKKDEPEEAETTEEAAKL